MSLIKNVKETKQIIAQAEKLTSEEQYEFASEMEYNFKVKNHKFIAKMVYAMSAKSRNINAMFRLGRILSYEKDYERSNIFFKEVYKSGYVEALREIGLNYYNQGEIKKAYSCWSEAAKSGDSESFVYLAEGYLNGDEVVDQDFDKAIRCFKRSANKGNYTAILYLEEIYLTDKYNKKNLVGGIKFFRKLFETNIETKPKLAMLAIKNLIKCYTDLYYEEIANIGKDRSKQKILNQKKYKEQAIKYLELAKNYKRDVLQSLRNDKYYDTYENSFNSSMMEIKPYISILEDGVIDLSNMTYEEFKEKYYDKHSNIFLLSTKDEFELYEDGIKRYFDKRDVLPQKIERKIQLEHKIFKNNLPIIKKMLKLKGVADIDKVIRVKREDIEKQIKEDTLVDFSDCVVNLDKYIEEILKFIFKVGFDQYQQTEKERKEKQFNDDIDNILVVGNTFEDEFIAKLFASFQGKEKFNKAKLACLEDIKKVIVKRPKTFDSKITNIRNFLNDNIENLNDNQIEFIENILKIANVRDEINSSLETKKKKDFTLGTLFFHTFTERQISINGKNSTKKVLDEKVVEYIKSIKPNLKVEEIEVKLNELISKIELFRVVVRNVASHTTELSQQSIEEGLNICIMQNNSIFALIDELFGEYILKKYIEKQYVKNLTV